MAKQRTNWVLRAGWWAIPSALDTAEDAVKEGERDASKVVRSARGVLEAESLVQVDYVELVDPATFVPLTSIEDKGLLLIAASLGETRLIDNALIEVEKEG